MKVLLLGGSGQVGFELQRALVPVADLVVPGFGGVPRLDLGRLSAAEDLVTRTQPELVVNAAAYTSVDKAESEPQLAMAINADAPGAMARAAEKCGAAIIHYSTDYVFDGSGAVPWREGDSTGPLNVYGESKLAGEEAVRAAKARHMILRTSWVHAPHGKNFARTMLRLAVTRDTIKLVDDQFGAPTAAELIADATVHAVLRTRQAPELWGTYHLVASGETSWHGYASHLLRLAQEQGLIARMPQAEAVGSAEFPTPARRPKNSRLANDKFCRTFGLRLPDWKIGVARLVRVLVQAAA